MDILRRKKSMDPEILVARAQKKVSKGQKKITDKNEELINKQIRHIMKLKDVVLTDIKSREDKTFTIKLHQLTDNFDDTKTHLLEYIKELKGKFPFLSIYVAQNDYGQLEFKELIIKVHWNDFLTFIRPRNESSSSSSSSIHGLREITEHFNSIKKINAHRMNDEITKILNTAKEHITDIQTIHYVYLVKNSLKSEHTREHFLQLVRLIRVEHPFIEIQATTEYGTFVRYEEKITHVTRTLPKQVIKSAYGKKIKHKIPPETITEEVITKKAISETGDKVIIKIHWEQYFHQIHLATTQMASLSSSSTSSSSSSSESSTYSPEFRHKDQLGRDITSSMPSSVPLPIPKFDTFKDKDMKKYEASLPREYQQMTEASVFYSDVPSHTEASSETVKTAKVASPKPVRRSINISRYPNLNATAPETEYPSVPIGTLVNLSDEREAVALPI